MSKYLKTTFLIISILCNLIFIYLLKRPAFLVNAGYIDNDNVKIADVNTAMVQMPTPSKSIITTPIPTLAEIPIITPISTQPEAPIIAAIEKDSETQIDRWVSQSNERLDQLFYGTWDIVDLVSTELGLPSSYSGFREDGSFRGPDFSKIIGKEITFRDDCVEYEGETYELAYGFLTYTHKLLSEDDEFFYHTAKTFGITGNYYSVVYFVLPDNFIVKPTPAPYEREIHFYDLCYLILKDNNTIYASDGVLSYLLERK